MRDEVLCKSIKRAEAGQVDADLGGGLIKQRVARAGHGRSGGYRSFIAWRARERAVFIYGFAKSGQDDLEPDELRHYQKLAREMLGMSVAKIQELVAADRWREVECDDEA